MCQAETSRPAKPCAGGSGGGSVQSCPCSPISGVRVTAVTFQSDHNVLKSNAADWTNSGLRFAKPEWTPASQAPVSHSMDQKVKLKVELQVDPSNACPEQGTIEGAAGGVKFPPVSVSLAPGKKSVTVESSTKLPRKVQELPFAVDWKVKAPSGEFGSSTSNPVFVTMGQPIDAGWPEDGATVKRMRTAIGLVGPIGSLDPHTIVAGLMKKFPYYTLERDPAVPAAYDHPKYYNNLGGAWPMADYPASCGQCQAIVRFVRGVINQIGCPGNAEAVVIWADPDVNGGATVLEQPYGGPTLHNKSRTVGGTVWRAALAAEDPVAVGRVFPPGSMMNNYEACLKFTHGGVTKYYGGGAGVYASKDEVIKAFYALVWYSRVLQPSGNVYNRIEQIVRRF